MKALVQDGKVIESLAVGPVFFNDQGVEFTAQQYYDLGWREIILTPIIDPATQRYGELVYNLSTDIVSAPIINTVMPIYDPDLQYLGAKYYNVELGVDTYYVIDYTPEQLAEIAAQKAAREAERQRRLATITKYQFMSRFTMDEKKTIFGLGSTNIDIKVWIATFNISDDIYLKEPDTIEGVNMLETAGIIGVGRAAEILAVPLTVYNG